MKHTLFIIVISIFITGCTSKPIHNIENEHVPTIYKQPSIKDVEKSIINAAIRRGWSPHIIKPGLIEASISVRTHKATVEIPFTESEYSINYKSSENLNYSDGNIHRNYNNWVIKLSRTIQEELGVNTQNY